MSERRKVNARAVFFVLVVANVLFFTYARISLDSRTAASSRIENLQINPGRIRLTNTATRGPGGAVPKSACLEWGPFTAVDAGRAEVAIGRLGLARAPVQRLISEGGGSRRFAYFVREPEAATVAKIADLQRGFPGTEIKAGPCPS